MKASDKYPGIILGFSTQNFLKAMPLGVDNLKEIIDFAAADGYAFIELRDPSAELTEEECRMLAQYAAKKNVEVIYEMHKDLFDPGFQAVFERAVRNTAAFGKPGYLRSILSWSEFAADENKKGWTKDELDHLTTTADSFAAAAQEQGVKLILENIVEPWFGLGEELGLVDFFAGTTGVGLQFDTANPFLPSCRRVADPGEVAAYLGTIPGRWYTTHLKCGARDNFQPFLMENPLPFERVFELMASNGISYAALELLAADTREECYENHRKSIAYLAELDLVELNK